MAVYTEVGDDDLVGFLAAYGVGDLVSFKGIAEGVENSNYLVQTTADQFILTLYEKRVAERDLPFFLGLMEHLALADFVCPTPVRRQDGAQLAQLAGRPAALVTFLDGVWPRKPTTAHCHAVGRAMAELHLAAGSFTLTRANGLGPDAWPGLFARFRDAADTIHPGLSATIATELEALDALWPEAGALPTGVIHADLFPDNIFFRDGALSGVIDFYFACQDLLAYDIAIALNAWCFEPNISVNLTKGRALLAGYESVRPLEPQEVAALPVLCRGAALRFLLTRAFDWLNTPDTALVKPHDPLPYLRRLWVHQQIESARDYGRDDGDPDRPDGAGEDGAGSSGT